jgi:hypothetical protein
MGALLNFVPDDVELMAADRMATIEQGQSLSRRCCYICHEIGSGPYYAYLWGESLRAYFELPQAGHMLATNLHADTYEQARDQICDENGVSEVQLRQMNLMIFLSVGHDGRFYRRRIEEIRESDGTCDHRCVFTADRVSSILNSSNLVTPHQIGQSAETITQLMASNARTIREVRAFIMDKHCL